MQKLFCSARLTIAALLFLTVSPALASTNVFVSGTGGYNTYRIPALYRTTNGTLLAFCEGRVNSSSDTGNIDTVLRRSFDGGLTWTTTQLIWSDGSNTCGNPTVVQDISNARIWLFMTWNNGQDTEAEITAGTSISVRKIYSCYSDNDGATWSAPVNRFTQVQPANTRWDATGPGRGIQMVNGSYPGRLIIPAIGRNIQSDDHGATWTQSGWLASSNSYTSESQEVEISGGVLLRNDRASGSYAQYNARLFSSSTDQGASWGPLEVESDLLDPICQASTISVNYSGGLNGRILVFSNPSATTRVNMTIQCSLDDGVTWPVGQQVYSGSSAYSCLAELGTNAVGLLYERDSYGKITFDSFSINGLMDSSATWINAAGGEWESASNWNPTHPAGGYGNTAIARFDTLDISGTVNVYMATNRTLEGLQFGDANSTTSGAWSLQQLPGYRPFLTLAGTNPYIRVGTNTRATITVQIAGTNAWEKQAGYPGTLILSAPNTFTGTLTNNSGILRLSGGANRIPAGNDIVLNYPGSLDLNGNAQTFDSVTGNGNITTGGGALTLGSGGSSFAYSGAISDAGSVTKSGSGIVTLAGTNTYAGSTAVIGGSLVVNGSIGNSAVTVQSGGTLGGIGSIGGTVNVESGGTLSPGWPSGTLTINNSLELAGTTLVAINPTNGLCSRIQGLTSLVCRGSLVVSNIAGPANPPQRGQTFQILNPVPSAVGNFSSITPALNGGLAWSFNPATGVLGVVPAPATYPTNISFAMSGVTLQLTWPTSHLGWIAQSNALNLMDPGGWFDIPGSSSVTNLVITPGSTPTNVFYRLRSP